MQSPNEILGQIIADHWQITEYFGDGNMSFAYKAQDTGTGKVITLKLIKDKILKDISISLEEFAAQIKQFIALNHENISNYYDIHLADGHLFLLCDYLQGESLAVLLSKSGKLPLEKCVALFQQIGTGLAYAHEQKILHGDLRPNNIFIVNDQFNIDEPKIVDFGFMQLITKLGQATKLRTTSAHPIFGNAAYLSPEQRIGHNIDRKSDLYSLGCLMYEAACGKSPFISKSAMETTYKQRNQRPIELQQLLPEHHLLGRYQQITDKLLQIDPKKRYQSADLVAQDLGLLLNGKETDWQKKANLLKESKYSILLRHKWQIITLTFSLVLIAWIFWNVNLITNQYSQPWAGTPIDNNRLWTIQDKAPEPLPVQLLKQRDWQSAKVSQIEKGEGKSSAAYIKNLFILTQYLLACRQWAEAQSRINELQTIDTTHLIDHLDILANLGLSQLMMGDLSGGEQSANKILVESARQNQSDQKFIESKLIAFKILGDTASQRNEIEKAENMYNQLYKISKDSRLTRPVEYAYATAVLADILRKEKKFDQSVQLYKEAIDWGENYVGHQQIFMAKAFYGLALAYYQQGKFKEAQLQLKQALPIAIAKRGPENDFVLTIKHFSDYLLFHENIFAWSKANLENKK